MGKTAYIGTKVTLNEVAYSKFYAPMYVPFENGYFAEEGLDVTLVIGFGADKTMTALLSGEADIGFMEPESTIYTYQGGMEDYAVNFAQLTQRAGNFVVGRELDEDLLGNPTDDMIRYFSLDEFIKDNCYIKWDKTEIISELKTFPILMAPITVDKYIKQVTVYFSKRNGCNGNIFN